MRKPQIFFSCISEISVFQRLQRATFVYWDKVYCLRQRRFSYDYP